MSLRVEAAIMSQAVAEPRTEDLRWSNRSLLKSLRNPSSERYEVEIHCPEVSFLGKAGQPDFACVDIRMVPGERVIELKSLKRYLFSLRNALMSYERCVNVLYEDLMETYRPTRLVVQIELRARGGISSKLTIHSDWRS